MDETSGNEPMDDNREVKQQHQQKKNVIMVKTCAA